MRGTLLIAAIAAGLATAAASAKPRPPRLRDPVVVELFTAQGCASCPDANRLLGEIARRKGVLALTFPVDYWDYLGWKDTFAQPEFTARQRAYVTRLKVREIYTPEVVVGGRKEAAGLDRDAIGALVDAEMAGRPGEAVKMRVLHGGQRVAVAAAASGPSRSADVWLVRYDPQDQSVRIRTGDNKGKLVVQSDVVRELVRLGGFSGRARTYAVPKADHEGLKAVVLVQGVRGGPILATAKL